ncbi:hypothetical protein [Amycolatopsis rifamycinica]|uniref:Uncharacterized protein n=1 Tax=Amycolatopsis rifamycinica TaxID=287986 RepID=A0A066U8X2_9PSEU|nr:hypothetical protein [Amycolatopsis rifamycinica]KDN23916.1 hypothetical protein DV20_02330 [Amycolatopsis rifamycinica]
MTVLATRSESVGPLLLLLLCTVVVGGLVAAHVTLLAIRMNRASQPREQQMARLAAQLDGRGSVKIRMIEFGIGRPDLLMVARSRGYALIEHQFGKYYEFVYAPHRAGTVAPWSL